MILRDFTGEIDKLSEEFQFMYLASKIINGSFNFFKIKCSTLNPGKSLYNILKIWLNLFFFIDIFYKITSSVQLAYNAKV